MRDAIVMWRHTKMVVLVALTAAIYAAILIPFKPIPIIPGITEIRPAAVIPFVCGLLFGPAAAWGSAIGNLMGDFFGTLGPGSLFGIVGNFLLAYVPYRLWHLLRPNTPATGSPGQVPLLVVVVTAGSTACAVIIGFGVDLLGIAPYQVVSTIIAVNNILVGTILGIPLLALVQSRAYKRNLTYRQILSRADLAGGIVAIPAAVVVLAAGLIGAFAALDKAGVVGSIVGTLIAPLSAVRGEALWLPAEMALRTLGLYCSIIIVLGSLLLARQPFTSSAHGEGNSG